MTIDELKARELIIYETISGSRAYGLDSPGSDTDIRGVFIMPCEEFYGFDYVEQVTDETNDTVYYELKKFFSLLARNNPTVLEMLYSPEQCVRVKSPLFDRIKRESWLTRLCSASFAKYAASQVKRARGLNKKIVNPMPKERKGVLDFCYVTEAGKTVAFKEWLSARGYKEEWCGLAKLEHFRDSYALYYSAELSGGGVLRKSDSQDVFVTNIPKGMEPVAYLHFNRDGYKRFSKEYTEYWQWVDKRNEQRYQSTLNHGKNYDAKNMMHTFRLLTMAKEIARDGLCKVRREEDREFFLSIKAGNFEYDELLGMADELIAEVEELFERSSLPESPDMELLEQLLVEIRREFYSL